MANPSSSLRFDHREIAVIFMLFIFVSLLMFTVGILVGKGLTQAKYEGAPSSYVERNLSHTSRPKLDEPDRMSAGSSVTTPTAPATASAMEHETSPAAEITNTASVETQAAPLKLVPQKPKDTTSPSSLLEPMASPETESLLKNPKIQALVESDPKAKRKLNSLGVPESYATGKFSVQIGSYPNEKEAQERVESLKKLGFPHAQFSAKTLGENKEVWYRVWLGFFPDYDSANASGIALKDRGEVKQYLVRKVDSSGRTD